MKQHVITYSSDLPENATIGLFEHNSPAGASYPVHWHDYLEFEIVVSGQAEHDHNGSVYPLSAGSAYMMCYNDFHGLTALTDLTVYSLHITDDLLHPELMDFLEFNKLRCQFSPGETEAIVETLKQIDREAASDQPFRNLRIKHLAEEVIISLIRKSTISKDHVTPPPIRQAVAFLRANFRRELTLEGLAKELGFSPNYLGQLFKAETGSTFNEYLNSLRLKYACSLLTFSDLAVKEIAFAAGYNSVEYFLYQFKKNLRTTPSRYRG